MKAVELVAERPVQAVQSPPRCRIGKLGALIVAIMLAPGWACGDEAMATLPVRYIASVRLWVLSTEKTSYVMGINEQGELQAIYWGGKVGERP